MRIAPLKIEAIQPLLEVAIAMHDQQEKAATKYVAVVGAVLAAVITAAAAVVVAGKAGSKDSSGPSASVGSVQQVAPLPPPATQAVPKANVSK
jgi:hypothetical protein